MNSDFAKVGNNDSHDVNDEECGGKGVEILIIRCTFLLSFKKYKERMLIAHFYLRSAFPMHEEIATPTNRRHSVPTQMTNTVVYYPQVE